jgi:hypothetical protein
MNVAIAIDRLLPGAKFGGVAGKTLDEYEALRWEDARPKPTWAAIQAAWDDYTANHEAEERAKVSDIETADERLKLVVKALVICVNKRLPAGNKITLDELKQEIVSILEAAQ